MARYELVERIGVGGMAEIFRGKATADGGFEKPVAIKKILPHLSQDKRFVELLITEAKTLSQLRHRNIVQIYDVGLGDDGQYFLVMEYVDGIDLGELYEALEKRSRRLPIDVAIFVTAEVCEALEHAHRARGPDGQSLGLVHRDVSPSNVLLSRSGEVKLTDFGIAKRTEETTGHGGVRGKFAYISPEQAHNKHVDGRSDVYSLGIVLYELVTGRRLFSDLPDFDALRAVREGRTPRPRDVDPGIDEELERILQTALAPRPEDRFATAAAFGAQLRGYRYSLASTVADPAVEVARMVEEHGGTGARRDGRPLIARESTFVRIATVDGFTGGFELSEESSDSGITGEVTRAAADQLDLENEQTRAVRVLGARAPLGLDDLDTRIGNDPAAATPGRSATTGEFDLSDAETSVLDYRRPRGLLDHPPSPTALGAATLRLHGGNGAGAEADHGGNGAGAPPPPMMGPAPSPWMRSFFFGGRFNQRDGRPTGPPILGAHAAPSRRRAVIIAGAAAVLLAVIAFVVAGVLIEDDTSSAAAWIDDAGPPPDAAPMTMAPEKVQPRPERPKRKKKKPAKKKTTKTTKKRASDKK